jgi:phosphomannomutase
LITSKAVPEIISELGGKPVRTRVGHSFIKATMAQTGAVFGGEHSGHFYFRNFWKADSGMLAAMHTLATLGENQVGTKLSDVIRPFIRYVASGEINTKVSDAKSVVAKIRENFSDRAVDIDNLDGMTVYLANGWFNVRSSNTEPLLRLNAEANTKSDMESIRDEVLAIMNSAK